MTDLPMIFRDGHLFLQHDDRLWLFDTGAPQSFGDLPQITLAGQGFHLEPEYLGLSASTLSDFVGVECGGLLGGDVLGSFDHILNPAEELVTLSTAELEHVGTTVPLSEFMSIPIVTVEIGGREHRMYFDTGAQLSYFQDESLEDFPAAGSYSDFYPGVGEFDTDTHHVDAELGGIGFTLRCGTLPGLLGTTLMLAGVSGIVGNSVVLDRVVGYFPRRRKLVL